MRRANCTMCVIAGLFGCAGAAGAACAGDIILNGSFEQGRPLPPPNNFLIVPNHADIDHWTVTVENVDWIENGFWEASDGLYSLDMNGSVGGDPRATITQNFATKPGSTYTVEFDLAGNPGGVLFKRLEVSADGQSQVYEFDARGQTHQDMGWVTHTFEFVADGGTATLAFTSLEPAGLSGPALDNVHVFGEPGEPCLGDLDFDGVVGTTDLIIMLGAWGENPGHIADLDGDDIVGTTDLITLLGAWGPCA